MIQVHLAVTAPMVAIKTASGNIVHLTKGEPVAGSFDPDDVDRLTSIGMVGMVPVKPTPPPWPPAPADTDQQVEVPVTVRSEHLGSPGHRGERAAARLVELWGDIVAVNTDGEVYCHRCLRFVPVSELHPSVATHDVEYRPWWSE